MPVIRSARNGIASDFREAIRDIVDSVIGWRLWSALATHDILARYRGSILGPFWITATTGAMVMGVGVLYSQLFNQEIRTYIPWLATGLIFWQFCSSSIIEGCDSLIFSSAIIKQTSLPVVSFVFRTVYRNLIVLAHQAVILVVVLFYFHVQNCNVPLAIAGALLVTLNLVWISLLLSLVSARFRDVPQVVVSIMQLLLFLTPVFWRPEGINSHRAILTANPFYHMLEVTRRPLIGEAAASSSYVALGTMACVGLLVTLVLFARARRRVVHFL